LVLVHGLMATGEMFEPIIADLATHHRVIVPDLRGHGRSRALPPPYSPAQMAKDIAQLLDHLGVDRTALLGYSHGGTVVQQFALDYPTRASRIVLACTYAFNMATMRERIEGHLVPIVLTILGVERFARLVVSQGMKHVSPERRERAIAMIATQDRATMISAWEAAMVFDSRPRLHEITCPTLVVAGSNDKGVPLHHARMLHDGIRGSRLVIIDGADHGLLWTRPEDLLRVTNDFLGR
jgi:pimeloyl-ACP methyl ester carboxylesterase